MKNLKVTIAGLLVACLGIGVVSAQTSTPATPAAKSAPAKKSTKTKSTTGATKATDGSTTAKPAQHLKKDGSPDMRYKENKAATGKTTTPAKKTTTKKTAAPAATPAPAK